MAAQLLNTLPPPQLLSVFTDFLHLPQRVFFLQENFYKRFRLGREVVFVFLVTTFETFEK